jgi:hypothetical protein
MVRVYDPFSNVTLLPSFIISGDVMWTSFEDMSKDSYPPSKFVLKYCDLNAKVFWRMSSGK